MLAPTETPLVEAPTADRIDVHQPDHPRVFRDAPAPVVGSPLPAVEERPQPGREVGARSSFVAGVVSAQAPERPDVRERPRAPTAPMAVDAESLWSEYAAQPRLDSLLPTEASMAAVKGTEPVERPEPEYIPERLSVSVHDDLGDWTLDVRRHAQAVDLLFRGGQELASAITAARPDIESALASAGHSLGSFRHGGAPGREEHEAPPQQRPRAQARTDARVVHVGRIDRVA